MAYDQTCPIGTAVCAEFVWATITPPQPTPQVATKPARVTEPQTKWEPSDTEQGETYWGKAFKPDNIPVWIGGIAAILASIAGLVALWFFKQQADLMKDSLIDSKAAVTAAREAANIANRSLIATFRPRLIVRSILVRDGDPVNVGQEGEGRKIKFTVSNIGGSNATVTRLVCGAKLMNPDSFPAEPPYGVLADVHPGLALKPGQHQSITVPVPSNVVTALQTAANMPRFQLGDLLHFLGYIRYKDEADVDRSYGFCRRHNSKTGRFETVEDADYEYAD